MNSIFDNYLYYNNSVSAAIEQHTEDVIDTTIEGKYCYDLKPEKEFDNAIACKAEVISLASDLMLDGAKVFDYSCTIDLNGHAIVGYENKSGAAGWYLIYIKGEGVEVTIKNGSLSSGNTLHMIPVTADYKSVVNVEHCDILQYPSGECVYVNRGGKANIYGGSYKYRDNSNVIEVEEIPETNEGTMILCEGLLYYWDGKKYLHLDLLNANNKNSTVNDIRVYGGLFYGRAPYKGDDVLSGSFVAEGYKCIEDGETDNGIVIFKVVPEE